MTGGIPPARCPKGLAISLPNFLPANSSYANFSRGGGGNSSGGHGAAGVIGNNGGASGAYTNGFPFQVSDSYVLPGPSDYISGSMNHWNYVNTAANMQSSSIEAFSPSYANNSFYVGANSMYKPTMSKSTNYTGHRNQRRFPTVLTIKPSAGSGPNLSKDESNTDSHKVNLDRDMELSDGEIPSDNSSVSAVVNATTRDGGTQDVALDATHKFQEKGVKGDLNHHKKPPTGSTTKKGEVGGESSNLRAKTISLPEWVRALARDLLEGGYTVDDVIKEVNWTDLEVSILRRVFADTQRNMNKSVTSLTKDTAAAAKINAVAVGKPESATSTEVNQNKLDNTKSLTESDDAASKRQEYIARLMAAKSKKSISSSAAKSVVTAPTSTSKQDMQDGVKELSQSGVKLIVTQDVKLPGENKEAKCTTTTEVEKKDTMDEDRAGSALNSVERLEKDNSGPDAIEQKSHGRNDVENNIGEEATNTKIVVKSKEDMTRDEIRQRQTQLARERMEALLKSKAVQSSNQTSGVSSQRSSIALNCPNFKNSGTWPSEMINESVIPSKRSFAPIEGTMTRMNGQRESLQLTEKVVIQVSEDEDDEDDNEDNTSKTMSNYANENPTLPKNINEAGDFNLESNRPTRSQLHVNFGGPFANPSDMSKDHVKVGLLRPDLVEKEREIERLRREIAAREAQSRERHIQLTNSHIDCGREDPSATRPAHVTSQPEKPSSESGLGQDDIIEGGCEDGIVGEKKNGGLDGKIGGELEGSDSLMDKLSLKNQDVQATIKNANTNSVSDADESDDEMDLDDSDGEGIYESCSERGTGSRESSEAGSERSAVMATETETVESGLTMASRSLGQAEASELNRPTEQCFKVATSRAVSQCISVSSESMSSSLSSRSPSPLPEEDDDESLQDNESSDSELASRETNINVENRFLTQVKSPTGGLDGRTHDCVTGMKTTIPPHVGRFKPFVSPLSLFKSFRFHPHFADTVVGGLRSLTYSHNIDANKPFCPFDMNDACTNTNCPHGQHWSDVKLSDNMILFQLGTGYTSNDETDRAKWNSGLRDVLNSLQQRNVVDPVQVAQEITQFRTRFFGDATRIINLP